MSKHELTIIFAPLIGIAFFIFFITWTIKPEKQKDRIFIKRKGITSTRDFVELAVERWVLFRSSKTGYENNLSANFRIIPTFFSSLVISIFALFLYSFLNSNHSIMDFFKKSENKVTQPMSQDEAYTITFGFIGLWLGLFWKEKKDLHSKWEYLAGLYNLSITKSSNENSSLTGSVSILASFAIDTLTMGMWAHKSFYPLFENILLDAYLYSEGLELKDRESFRDWWRDKGMDFVYAEKLLEEYQSAVLIAEKIRHNDKEHAEFLLLLVNNKKSA